MLDILEYYNDIKNHLQNGYYISLDKNDKLDLFITNKLVNECNAIVCDDLNDPINSMWVIIK